MVFSSILFLFLFLPAILGVYYFLPHRFRNTFLLIASLGFYYVGENTLILVFVLSILINYLFGGLIAQKRNKYLYLLSGVGINLTFLLYFKYANFIIENLQALHWVSSDYKSSILLPIGISFYTFQGLSYLVDVYREPKYFQSDPIKLGLFISFFPQLIAGPIIKYNDIVEQLTDRTITSDLFTSGIRKFIRGLAKKVVIANHVAIFSDKCFALDANLLSTPTAWLGLLAFTIQIYFDFSGYSDMAIGMGRMFGFEFKENFDHPYIATSVRAFWRRWHISLSTWFRDYVYIPLGGNQTSKEKIYRNLFLVFVLTGLWHGANWTFLIWGLFHGLFIVGERIWPWKKSPKVLQHLYLLMVLMLSWVFFKSDTLPQALAYLSKLFAFDTQGDYLPFIYLTPYSVFIFILAIFFAMPSRSYLSPRSVAPWAKHLVYLILFIYTISELTQALYNPFIYFRF